MNHWTYDDGGRAAAGFTGRTGDCVTRSIAIVTGLPYRQVYDELFARSRDYWTNHPKHSQVIASWSPAKRTRLFTPRNGMHAAVYKPFLAELALPWTPTMRIGQGTTVHLRADELPAGRLIVRCSRHLTAMVDGIIHDTHDPTRGGTRAVYGYWTMP